MRTEIQKYRDFVHFLAINDEYRVFLNSDNEKAIAVFVELFKKAKECLYIYAGCLSNDVTNSSEYISSIREFIRNGGEVKVLLNAYNEETASQSDLLKRLAYFQAKKKNVIVKKTNEKLFIPSPEGDREIHFTVVDRKSYRIEIDIVNRKSICNMNDTQMGEKLTSLFDPMFDKATPLNLVSFFKMG